MAHHSGRWPITPRPFAAGLQGGGLSARVARGPWRAYAKLEARGPAKGRLRKGAAALMREAIEISSGSGADGGRVSASKCYVEELDQGRKIHPFSVLNQVR